MEFTRFDKLTQSFNSSLKTLTANVTQVVNVPNKVNIVENWLLKSTLTISPISNRNQSNDDEDYEEYIYECNEIDELLFNDDNDKDKRKIIINLRKKYSNALIEIQELKHKLQGNINECIKSTVLHRHRDHDQRYQDYNELRLSKLQYKLIKLKHFNHLLLLEYQSIRQEYDKLNDCHRLTMYDLINMKEMNFQLKEIQRKHERKLIFYENQLFSCENIEMLNNHQIEDNLSVIKGLNEDIKTCYEAYNQSLMINEDLREWNNRITEKSLKLSENVLNNDYETQSQHDNNVLMISECKIKEQQYQINELNYEVVTLKGKP